MIYGLELCFTDKVNSKDGGIRISSAAGYAVPMHIIRDLVAFRVNDSEDN